MSERILVFIPMYNCERQIGRVIGQFDEKTQRHFAELIVVDNRSTDQSASVAMEAIRQLKGLKARVLRNDENYGLGGSHKVAFNYALEHGFEYCVVLHGDDQGSIHDLVPLIEAGVHRQYDCLLGARFMKGSKLVGYSRFRTFGNQVFNALFSIGAGKPLYDLGSGLNMYATRVLEPRTYLRFGNDLTFNYYAILASVAEKWKMKFFPLTWREEDQLSNVKLVRQALKTLKILSRFVWNRQRFVQTDHARPLGLKYTSSPIAEAVVPDQQP